MSEDQVLHMIVSRLDRLDTKMDTMAEAVTSLARAEERIAGQAAILSRLSSELIQLRREEIEPLEERVATLERCQWRMTGIATTVAGGAAVIAPVALKWILP